MYVMLHITLIIMNDMYKLCIMVLVGSTIYKNIVK